MTATLLGLANDIDTDPEGTFPGSGPRGRRRAAALAGRRASSCCWAISAARCSDGQVVGRPVEPPRRAAAAARVLAAAHRQTTNCWCWRRPRFPATCATAPTPTSSWSARHPGGSAVEHRFVGLFTVAAMNANVLEIPLISRRVHEALAMAAARPQPSGPAAARHHPDHPALGAVRAQRRSSCSTWRRPWSTWVRGAATLLFLRADQLAHFVSCLVYLPRDRYTTAVRLEMQDILVREFGGVSIEYTARVSESPWAVVHFTVRLPDGSRPQRRRRLAEPTRPGSRTCSPRPRAPGATGCIGAVKAGSIGQADAEHYADGVPRGVQAGRHARPTRSTTSRSSKSCTDDSVKLVFAEGDDDETAQLTWYLGGRSASLSQLLPMLQCMGVVVLEERPFTVTRPDGLPVWIYQFKISPHRDDSRRPRRGRAGRDRRSGSPTRSPRSGRAASRSTGSTSWCCAPA